MEDQFGERVRLLRANRRMTLQALARASGVSVSMLSQVERGERTPTLRIALRIAEGLGCHLSEILDEPIEARHGVLRREGASGVMDPETGTQRRLLTPHLPPSLVEVAWYRLQPHGHAGPFLHRDTKLLEQVTVVVGRLRVTVGEEVHELELGDSLSFPGGVEHRFDNPGGGECAFVHVAHPSPG